jgi:hypothetical protein
VLLGGEWQRDGSFFVSAFPGKANPQPSMERQLYRVSADGRRATRILRNAESADLMACAVGRAVSRLSLLHRWLGAGASLELELQGRLTVGGRAARDRTLVLGRLGSSLPTEHVRALRTGADGTFETRIPVGASTRGWRIATEFYESSASEWSTTAFDSLRRLRAA